METENPKKKLFPLSREEAIKYGRKGGKSTSVKKALTRRKYCNDGCPIWDRCGARDLSLSTRTYQQEELDRKWAKLKKEGKTKGNKKPRIQAICHLKQMPKEVLDNTLDLLINGEEGIIRVLINNSAKMAQLVADKHDNLTGRGILSRELRETIKVVHGTKSRVKSEVKMEGVLTAEMFNEAYEAYKREKEESEENE